MSKKGIHCWCEDGIEKIHPSLSPFFFPSLTLMIDYFVSLLRSVMVCDCGISWLYWLALCVTYVSHLTPFLRLYLLCRQRGNIWALLNQQRRQPLSLYVNLGETNTL